MLVAYTLDGFKRDAAGPLETWLPMYTFRHATCGFFIPNPLRRPLGNLILM